MTKRREGDVAFTVSVPAKVAHELAVLAKKNDRTVTHEVRRALRQHVEEARRRAR